MLLFQDVVWMQIFLYRGKKVFFWRGIGIAGRGIPGAQKNGETVQKIIPGEANWQCGKEAFFPADYGV